MAPCDARPTVTFPAAGRNRPLTDTTLCCLVTEAHASEQLARGCFLKRQAESRTRLRLVCYIRSRPRRSLLAPIALDPGAYGTPSRLQRSKTGALGRCAVPLHNRPVATRRLCKEVPCQIQSRSTDNYGRV